MRYGLLVITVLALLAGCGQGSTPRGAQANRPDTPREAHEEHEHDAPWSYSGATGPEHWGELDPDYAVASTGRQQSPIDISDVQVREPHDIDFHYEPTEAVMVNNGHTVEVDFEKGAYIVLDETRYDLIQFHFHAPSEHTINHEHADAEVHFVHKNDRDELAVVAVMYTEGEHNEALHRVWQHMPQKPGDRAVVPEVFAHTDQTMPATDRHYRYTGSLTTPPCTEGVTWLVMQEPVEVSREQIERFREFYAGNNRPVQPLYDRTVISE